ncbi:sensor histidine kinase [Spirochaetia bacterium]|nr:sensor histidine kinase [Spirochaetia bacterium]
MMSLRNHLVLVYASFICAAVLLLGVVINRFAGTLFSSFVARNITVVSGHIVSSMEERYNPMAGVFDVPAVEALGMYFVHEGYIVSVEDAEGETVWDARSCDMGQCSAVIADIARRMERDYGLSGGFTRTQYPMRYRDRDIGLVNIETYGPFFYSESEADFLRTLNRFLLCAGIVFVLLSMVVSVLLATALSRPILNAAEAAKHIAEGDLSVRVSDRHGTAELCELSRSVNELACALEKGERWQKRLSADIAHELRTPLTCLQGNMEAMIDGVWEPTASRLASCHEEIRRLTKLVEDLSSLSILERDTLVLHRAEFDLSKLLTAAADHFTQAVREKGLELRVESGPSPLPVSGDYDRLMQVFINVISNAVKYTDVGSITVRAERLAGSVGTEQGAKGVREDRHYAVTVADTGIGISAAELPHIFDRFYRTDESRNRLSGGSGIGLSIALAIAEAHGGTIQAASEAGKGSVFTVRM